MKPANNINSLSKDQLSQADISQATPQETGQALDSGNFPDSRLNELSSDQLKDNLDKVKGKENQLNPEEYNKALKEQIGNPDVNVGAGDKPADVTVKPDSVEVGRADSVSNTGSAATAVEKATLRKDGGFEAAKVGALQTKDSSGEVTSQIKNGENIGYNPSTNTFDVGKADSIAFTVPNAPPIAAINVPPSIFKNFADRIEITPKSEGSTYTIMDQGGNIVVANAKKDGKIIIAKTPEPKYTMDEGTMLYLPQYGLLVNATEDNAIVYLNKRAEDEVHLEGEKIFVQFMARGVLETLWAKGMSTIRANKNEGIYYAELGSPSRIYFKENGKSFMLYRQENLPYRFFLVVNKPSYKMDFGQFKEKYKGMEAGYINNDEHIVYLQGRIDYLRETSDSTPKSIVESKHISNIIDMKLDEKNTAVEELSISNGFYTCKEEEILTSTHNYEYNIVEICNPVKQKVERYIAFEHAGTPNLVKNYKSFFGEERLPIIFSGRLLIIKKKSSSSIFAEQSMAQQLYSGEMNSYTKYFQACTQKPTIYGWFMS